MIVYIIIFSILSLVTLFTFIKEKNKKEQFGYILMKLKFENTRYLERIATFLLMIGSIYLLFRDINSHSVLYVSDKMLSNVIIAQAILYFISGILTISRLIRPPEIRESGIILSKGLVEYYDIRKIDWASEGKVEISFAIKRSNKLFKEKFVVKDYQVDELNEIFQKRYYCN